MSGPARQIERLADHSLPYFTMQMLHHQEDVLDRVLALVVLLGDDMTQALAALGLTPSRTRLLWELRRRGPVPQRVLADALEVTPRAVTGLVDALAGDGLVTREPHPTDRRAALVTLTPRGEAVTGQLKRDHEALARALFGPMPKTELDRFQRELDGVIDRLQTHLTAATANRARRQSAAAGRSA